MPPNGIAQTLAAKWSAPDSTSSEQLMEMETSKVPENSVW